ncbi:gamma-glutamyl phosphate reductase [Lactarius hatsudake]|nr:gamma-glutamyl phosphate reductase [Lactarius hatsudake]
MSATSTETETVAKTARAAFEASQLIDSAERTRALHEIRKELEANKDSILHANGEDMTHAEAEAAAGRLAPSLVKRLDLRTGDKWDAMLQGVCTTGLELYRVSCPIGVLLVIFEARPEVVVNVAALALKSGNAVILKGGRESARTAAALARAIQTALARTALPSAFVQAVETRAEVAALLAQDRYIDLVIPRGSNALVRAIQHSTRIPVMGHADGLCAIYLDASADREKALRVVLDAKVDYPAACNAVETLLVHESLLGTTIWPDVARTLLAADSSVTTPNFATHVSPATPDAYTTEHLSLTLGQSAEAGRTFVRGVDSAGVFVNASTRFADGFRYGFGAEVGISTGRIHARGPVGLEGLVTYKYVLRSQGADGHIVGEFGSGQGKRQYTHQPIHAAELPL